jgi:uncharacterized protein YdbL (DUF1318 family)
MKTANRALLLLVAAGLLLTFAAAVRADDDKNTVLARMKQRVPAMLAAKKAGTIGEVFDGTLAAVKPAPPDDIASLINAENADRRQYFAIVAKEKGSTPEEVAEAFFKGQVEHSPSGTYIKGKDGVWRQKP